MIRQVWGPLVDLVGAGGYRAFTVGDWFLMKYANLLVYLVIAGLFVVGMFVPLPERKDRGR